MNAKWSTVMLPRHYWIKTLLLNLLQHLVELGRERRPWWRAPVALFFRFLGFRFRASFSWFDFAQVEIFQEHGHDDDQWITRWKTRFWTAQQSNWKLWFRGGTLKNTKRHVGMVRKLLHDARFCSWFRQLALLGPSTIQFPAWVRLRGSIIPELSLIMWISRRSRSSDFCAFFSYAPQPCATIHHTII